MSSKTDPPARSSSSSARLEPFAPFYKKRYSKYQAWIKTIEENEGGLDKFSKGWTGENGLVRSFAVATAASVRG